ncbi:amino acid ABC transporter substrate-binding protein [Hyphomicrobium sp.]|uniref:amino acid ABC transporter substrate-binding protein n=1 Tax=Hyphomicrobium sp. TaxID=82 RepID=UPI002E33EEBD|nr:amino acid ABC transporter substrate-binding protein [Hyphomicrobium sp.]HEX2841825.1 amino acid ABC transporter substrate-binding protein [Hyphomicrobium sp.]
MTIGLRAGLLAPLAVTACLVSQHAEAARLCALRDGPSGPCTCKVEGGGPGEFTTVNKSVCTKAARAKDANAAPAAAAAGQTQPAADAPATMDAAPAPPVVRTITTGATSPPTQASPAPTALPAPSEGRLQVVRERGKILCGVNTGLLGFSALAQTGEWLGLDADFCRAVAAAVFEDAKKVEFVPVETNERFEALQSGKIDLLARNTTWTMARDVDMGLEFAGVLYFDGQGFMTSDDRGLVSAQQLAGLKICVEAGTTTEQNMAYYFKAHGLEVETQTYPDRKEMLDAYASGKCDAYSGDRSALFSDRASFAEPAKHAVLPEVISKEPLGPVVAGGDRTWSEIVRWTLAGLINAEEVGLDRETAAGSGEMQGDARRLVDGAAASAEKLGLPKPWLRNVIAATGNYSEIFDANLGKQSPLGMDRGINALWKRGGIQFAPPMW